LLYLSERLLSQPSGNIGISADSKDENGQTPLSYAAEGGHKTVVKLLVKRDDVEANSRDERGLTPLFYAGGDGYEAVVKILKLKQLHLL
jgi:ankyrin repeat protein